MNIEDGYFISFFTYDTDKKQDPRAIVVIKDGVVSIFPNPAAPETDLDWLQNLFVRLSDLDPKSEEYANTADELNGFWAWNGYTANPSTYITIKDYSGEFDAQMRKWKLG